MNRSNPRLISDAIYQFIYAEEEIEHVSRDYFKEYEDLIKQARLDELFGGREKIAGEYIFETHHVIPRCLGGSDHPSNLVNLTLGEHFECHFLLWKMYRHEGLSFAYRKMHGDMSIPYEEAKAAFIERRPTEY